MFIPLIPTPNLHFFTAGITNYCPRGKKDNFLLEKIDSIHKMIFHSSTSIPFENGKLISSFHFLNRNQAKLDICEMLEKNYKESKIKFIEWAPPSIHYSNLNSFLCKESSKQTEIYFFNHTAIKYVFKEILMQYDLLRKRNAFLNNYLKEFKFINGLELFQDSRENLISLLEEYEKAETNFFP